MKDYVNIISRKVLKSEFNKNVFTLIFGTSFAQLITFLLYPLISRLYTPSDFGVFGLYLSITGMVALIATGRYELSIILPSSNKQAFNLFGLSFIINTVVTLLSLLAVLCIFFFKIKFEGEYHLFNYVLYFAPLIIFLSSASNIFQNWFIRNKKFKLLSISKVLTSLSNNGFVVALGFISAGIWGLLTGLLVSLIIVLLYFTIKFLPQIKEEALLLNKEGTKFLAKKYIDFPRANCWHALSDMFQSQGIIYFLAAFFTSNTVGLYAFSMRILQAPMMLIVSSFSQVFYQRASEMHNKNEDLLSLLKSTIMKMSFIAAPIMFILMVFGPDLFAFIFSEKWRQAGVYARILAPWICIDFIRYSIGQMPIVLGKIRQVLYWSICGNVIICLSLFVGGYFLADITHSFVLLSISMTIYLVLLILWIFKITQNAHKR